MPSSRIVADVIGILGTDTPGTSPLEVVYPHRDLQGGMDIDQPMHRIRLAAKLQEQTTSARQNLCEDLSKVVLHQRRNRLVAVLGHKHDEKTNRNHRMR